MLGCSLSKDLLLGNVDSWVQLFIPCLSTAAKPQHKACSGMPSLGCSLLPVSTCVLQHASTDVVHALLFAMRCYHATLCNDCWAAWFHVGICCGYHGCVAAAVQEKFPSIPFFMIDDPTDLQRTGAIFQSFYAPVPRLPTMGGDMYWTFKYKNFVVIVASNPLLPALVGYHIQTMMPQHSSKMFMGSNGVDKYPQVRSAPITCCAFGGESFTL